MVVIGNGYCVKLYSILIGEESDCSGKLNKLMILMEGISSVYLAIEDFPFVIEVIISSFH